MTQKDYEDVMRILEKRLMHMEQMFMIAMLALLIVLALK